jgi:hypothetical protein
MKTFRQYVEMKDNLELYMSLVPPQLLARREKLSKMVDDAYGKGDHKTAERLDAELEEVEEKIDSMLHDMDDPDGEDVATGNTGGEEEHIDRDWSVQDDMAKIYARYLAGDFEPGGPNSHMTYDTVKVDPEEAKRNGWEFRQAVDHNGKPAPWFYRDVPITKQAAFAKMLRGAIWESPNLSISNPDVQKIKSMTDEQIIDAAKDAYEWKSGLRGRIGRSSSG